MIFNWIRPDHIAYPNVWLKFQAKDLDSDDLVEYVVQDLPEDRFDDAIQVRSETFLQNMRVWSILNDRGNFDVFEKYGVDKYLTSFAMHVPKEYAGRKIGERLLEASKYLARPYEVKLYHSFFTSDSSNKIADNLGFNIDIEMSFKEIQCSDPSLNLENIESSKASLRTWIFGAE